MVFGRCTYSGEEVIEGASTEMHVLHEGQKIESRITNGLHEPSFRALALLGSNSIALNAVVCHLPLLWLEPTSGEWEVWQEEYGYDGDSERYSPFNDEEPVLHEHVSENTSILEQQYVPSRLGRALRPMSRTSQRQ